MGTIVFGRGLQVFATKTGGRSAVFFLLLPSSNEFVAQGVEKYKPDCSLAKHRLRLLRRPRSTTASASAPAQSNRRVCNGCGPNKRSGRGLPVCQSSEVVQLDLNGHINSGGLQGRLKVGRRRLRKYSGQETRRERRYRRSQRNYKSKPRNAGLEVARYGKISLGSLFLEDLD